MIATLRREPAAAALAAAAALGLALLVGYPLFSVLQEAVVSEGGFDPEPLTRVMTNPVQRQIVVNTLVMGSLTGLGATLLGFALALTPAGWSGAARGPRSITSRCCRSSRRPSRWRSRRA